MARETLFASLKKYFYPLLLPALVACGGSSGSSDDLVKLIIPAENRIFLYDDFFRAVVSIADANPPAGNLTADTAISGANADFFGSGDMTLDIDDDRLYVSNIPSIMVYDNASRTSGNFAPSRRITSPSFVNLFHLFFDEANDLLYVVDVEQGIWIVANAGDADGSVTPARRIIDSFGTAFLIQGIALDTARDILYVSVIVTAPSLANRIFVFDNAGSLDGSGLTADRVFESTGNGGIPGNIVIDEVNDRLYMSLRSGAASVNVFDSASTLNGNLNPDREIILSSGVTDIKIDFDNDRLYAIDPNNLYIVQNAGSASGNVAATIATAPNVSTVLQALAIAP